MAASQRYRVVIYGSFAESFHLALRPSSPIWNGVQGVEDVLMIPDIRDVTISDHPDPDVITVLIPLSIENSINAPKNFISLLSKADAIRTLHNKNLFADFINNHNLTNYFPATFSSVDSVKYPCVLKRTNLADGAGIIIVPSEAALKVALKHPLWVGQETIIQSFIPGNKEYVTHAICLNGKIIWECTFLYKMKDPNPMRKSASNYIFHEVTTSPKVTGIVESVIGLLNYSGPINVDYKILYNSPILFEINPRFGASLMKERTAKYLQGALNALLKAAVAC